MEGKGKGKAKQPAATPSNDAAAKQEKPASTPKTPQSGERRNNNNNDNKQRSARSDNDNNNNNNSSRQNRDNNHSHRDNRDNRGNRHHDNDNHNNDRPQRPKTKERIAYEAKVQKIRDEMAAYKKELETINEQLSSGSASNSQQDPQEQKAREAFNKSKTLVTSVRSERNHLQNQVDDLIEERNELRQRVQELTNNLQYKKLEDVERQISKLENYLTTNTLNTQEEKKVLGQIRALTNSRNRVEEYVQCTERMSELNNKISSLLEQIKTKQADLANRRAEADAAMDKLNKIRQKSTSAKDSLDQVFQKRRELSEKLKVCRDKLQTAREEFDKEVEAARAAREQERINREIERERIRKQREEDYLKREADREKRRQEAERRRIEKPYEVELETCKNLLGFFGKQQSKEDEQPQKRDVKTPASAPSTSSSSAPKKVSAETLNQFKAKQGQNSARAKDNNNANAQEVTYLLHHVIPLTKKKGKSKARTGGMSLGQLEKVISNDKKAAKQVEESKEKQEQPQAEAKEEAKEETKEENKEEAKEENKEAKQEDKKEDSPAATPAEPAKKKPKKVSLPYRVVRMLNDLDIPVPATEEDLPQTLKGIEDKQNFFESYKVGDPIYRNGKIVTPGSSADATSEQNHEATAPQSSE